MKSTQPISANTYKGRVFVGLSGGVDSAVSAALLKEQGYDVTGVFIKVWQPDWLPCTWREERRDAMRVAARLGIPFLFFDFSEEYKKGVADYMIEEYRKGRTPNPDVMCNREIKFGAFWRKAQSLGADYIATGHYLSGVNDQRYFLWTLTQEDWAHSLFPVGHMEKSEVRALAQKFNIPVAQKKDSQGICFLGTIDMKDFLSHYIEGGPGDVLNTKGEVIGRHNGALFYTLGERHGFEIFHKTPNAKPHFVMAKDVEANTIITSDSEIEISNNLPTKIKIERINGEIEGDVTAQIRYRGEKLPVKVKGNELEFESPQAAASGQSVVFYKDGEMLGGAIISQ